MITSGMVRFHDDLGPLMVGIDEVAPHPENYNNGDVDKIMESIEVNGVYRPIFVQRSTGYAIAGNHVWEACKALDSTVIAAVALDVDDDEARRIMLADNEIARLAVPDPPSTLALLDALQLTEHGLQGTGVEPQRHEQLRALADVPLDAAEFAQWPTVCFQVPPTVRAAFYRMTSEARDDRERFEILMRLAGWDGK